VGARRQPNDPHGVACSPQEHVATHRVSLEGTERLMERGGGDARKVGVRLARAEVRELWEIKGASNLLLARRVSPDRHRSPQGVRSAGPPAWDARARLAHARWGALPG